MVRLFQDSESGSDQTAFDDKIQPLYGLGVFLEVRDPGWFFKFFVMSKEEREIIGSAGQVVNIERGSYTKEFLYTLIFELPHKKIITRCFFADVLKLRDPQALQS